MTKFRFQTSWTLLGFVIIALSILIFLGTWQGQKIGPKTALLNSIERGISSDPIALPLNVDDLQAILYHRVSFDGMALDVVPVKVFGTNLNGKPGYSLYKPVLRQNNIAVFVNFGWIPIDADTLPVLPSGQVSVSGVVMQSAEAGSFTPVDQLEKNEWFTANVHEIAKHYELGAGEYHAFRIFADHIGNAGDLPLGGQVRVDIPNDHFEYMLTWYGLAAGLIGVFIAFSLKRSDE